MHSGDCSDLHKEDAMWVVCVVMCMHVTDGDLRELCTGEAVVTSSCLRVVHSSADMYVRHMHSFMTHPPTCNKYCMSCA